MNSTDHIEDLDQNASDSLGGSELSTDEAVTKDLLENDGAELSGKRSYEIDTATQLEAIKIWGSESRYSKIAKVITTLVPILWGLVFAAILYSAYAPTKGWTPIIDFEEKFYGKSDAEIFEFLSGDLIVYISVFLGVMFFVGFLSALTRTLCYFDLANWIDHDRMNVGRLIVNDAEEKTQQVFRDFLLEGLLVKDRPEVKKVHIAKLVCTAIALVLLVSSLALFIQDVVTGFYEGFELRGESEETVLKEIFLGGSAFLLYFTLIFMLVHTVIQNSILKKKRREYLFEVHSSNRYPV